MVIGIDASRAFVKEKTGTEEYSYQVITQMILLPESKMHDFVLFIRPGVIIPSKIRQNNVQIVELKYRYLWTQVGLAMATWGYKLDVLWIPAHTLPILRRLGLRTVVTIHGLEYKWLPEYRNLLQRWYLPLSTFYAANNANQLIAVSRNTKKDLLKEVQIDTKKIKVILEGVNAWGKKQIGELDKLETLKKFGLIPKKYILFVGTLQPRKNLPALLVAYASLRLKYRSYKLVISGGKGWQSAGIFKTMLSLGIEEKVVFTGRVSDQEKNILISQASIYVQPSLTEGFGLPLLEAMQAGIPVIASNGGALPEVVSEAGLVVSLSSNFVKELAGRMEQVLGDRKLRNELSARGRKRAEELTWKKTAKETLKTIIK